MLISRIVGREIIFTPVTLPSRKEVETVRFEPSGLGPVAPISSFSFKNLIGFAAIHTPLIRLPRWVE